MMLSPGDASDEPPVTPTILRALAPSHLPRLRADRYRGEEFGVPLAHFAPIDRRLLVRLYASLGVLVRLAERGADAIPALRKLARDEWGLLARAMRTFGQRSRERDAGEAVLRVAHELRGGALVALVIELSLVEGDSSRADARAIFLLARDHMKIVRGCVVDIDRAGRARDLLPRIHRVDQLVERWGQLRAPGGRRVTVSADYEGPIAESCVEFATLERAVYNLLNNALTHASEGGVRVRIVGVPERGPESARFVVANALHTAQHRALVERSSDDHGALFLDGFTTSGSGLGLRICADIVACAYGLTSPAQAVASGYLGARLLGGWFVAWVHWPVAADDDAGRP